MSFALQISLMVPLIIFLIYILHLVLHKKFRERDSFSWICLIFFFVGMVLAYRPIDIIAMWFGIEHEFALVLVLGILFILTILFHQSYKISHLTNTIIELAQKLSLLESLLQEKEKNESNHNKSSGNK